MIGVRVDWATEAPSAGMGAPGSGVARELGLGDGSATFEPPRSSVLVSSRLSHVSLVAEVRIDNGVDLRQELGGGADEPLAATLIRGYLSWGETRLAGKVKGDFAIVLWDGLNRKLCALRDPFGVKRLVYRSGGGRLWVATHVQQLLATFQTMPALDDQKVVEHLLWRQKATEATFFRDLRQVPPGHVLTATSSRINIQRYWFPPDIDRNRWAGPQDYCREFRSLFLRAVERRLRATSPVGIQISGGLDSSSIAGAADFLSRTGDGSTPALFGLSGVYPGLACDEGVYIDAVSRHVGFPVERWDGTQSDPVDLVAPSLDSPSGRITSVGGTMGDFTLARAHGAAAILSGQGGDQLTTPRGIVQDMLVAGAYGDAVRELLFFPGARARSRLARLRYLTAQSLPVSLRDFHAASTIHPPAWLNRDLWKIARQLASPIRDTLDFASHVQRNTWNNVTSQQVVRSLGSPQEPGDEPRIEYRFPFLDVDLVRFVLSIPYQGWPRAAPFARLHREALRDLLPPEIQGRFSKAEFTPALINRVTRAGEPIKRLLDEGEWACGRYVDRVSARTAWRAALRPGNAVGWLAWRRIWGIATLEAWMRAVLGYYRAAMSPSGGNP